MKFFQTKTILLIPVVLMVFTLFESSTHFSKNGCDGGTCSLFLFFYSFPLIIGWLFSIGGAFLILRNNLLAIFFGLFLFLISISVFSSIDISGIKELNTAIYIGKASDYLFIALGIFLAINNLRNVLKHN